MNPSRRNYLIKIAVSFGVCLLLAAFILFSRIAPSALAAAAAADVYMALCDAFFVPGTLITGLGLLFAVSNEGALDGLGYVTSITVKKLIPGKAAHMERYDDYVARKREKKVHGFSFLFVTGILFLVIAVIFLLLYNSAC